MKKFLSLVLALVMTMSLVTVAGAKDFTDADSVNYDEAVDVISALEVVGGYADGSFAPKGTLTRQAAAKIICNIKVGPEAAADLACAAAPFADVAASNQFAGYIAYCVNEGIIAGYGDGNFGPANKLTGYAFLKMLLTSLGYDATIEGYVGANAQVNILIDARKVGLLKGFDGKFDPAAYITREQAALFALNALKAYTVEYSDKGSNITIGDIVINTGAGSVIVHDEDTQENYKEQLFEVSFADVLSYDDDVDVFDAMGRPAIYWEYDGKEIGTYAKAADLVIENKLTEKEFDKLAKDEDVDFGTFDETDTANGLVWELFYDEDGEAVEYFVDVAAELVDVEIYKEDLVSSKDVDDRALLIGGLYAVADAEETDYDENAVEIDNFDKVFEAVEDDEDLRVLLITNEAGTKIMSVEIPETVEAKVTRVKDEKVTAGGETYLLADGVSASVGDDTMLVGANGCIYDSWKADGELSDVVYLDVYLTPDTDKYGADTYKAQIVNEKHEIVEWVVAEDDYTTGAYYTYELNEDDQYELEPAEAEYVSIDEAMDKDKTYVWATFAGEDADDASDDVEKKLYFADDMIVVYVGDATAEQSGKDLEVTVKEGVQDGVSIAYAVLNDDGELAIAYVGDAFDAGLSEDMIFVAEFDADAPAAEVEDKEGDPANAYTVYMDGEEVDIMIANTSDVSANTFYTYKINEKTGKYTLSAVDADKQYSAVVGENTITKDKYVSVDDLDDVTVDGKIYDLTDEGLTTLKNIAKWDSAEDLATINFVYDAEDEVITVVYVTFTEA